MSEFMVRPFAFMRLTHEALRAGFAQLREASGAGDLGAARQAWATLAGVVAIHKRHEEEAFFPLLDDRFDGAIAAAGLRAVHADEADHERAVEAALAAGDLPALHAALAAWAPSFEAHLVEEETIMMPLTQRVAPTVEGRAAAVRAILEVDWDGLRDVHLPQVARALAATKPYGPVRMFVAAVQAAAGDRYPELEPSLRAALPAETVATLASHGHLAA